MSETNNKVFDTGLKATGPLGLLAAIMMFFGGNGELNGLREAQSKLRERVAAAEATVTATARDVNRRLESIEVLLGKMDEKIDKLKSN